MKRNVCFSTLLLLSLLTGAIILFSCKSNLHLINKVTNQSQPADSVVLNLLGDTISHMLFSPSVVYAYKMRPQKAENDTLIGTYAVDYLIGELDSSYYGILQFFLKDSTNYNWTDELVKTPFSPNIGFEFVGDNQEKIHLLLAFNGCLLEILSRDQVVLHQQFKNEHYLLRFAKGLLPQSKYINHLLNTHK